jgi:hypothetical protein
VLADACEQDASDGVEPAAIELDPRRVWDLRSGQSVTRSMNELAASILLSRSWIVTSIPRCWPSMKSNLDESNAQSIQCLVIFTVFSEGTVFRFLLALLIKLSESSSVERYPGARRGTIPVEAAQSRPPGY